MYLRTLLFILLCSPFSFTKGQTDVYLNIHHKFDKSNFVIGQIYIDDNNQAIQITRLSYYIHQVRLQHDAGQHQVIQNHFLIDSEMSNYFLGNLSTTVEALESVAFNLGVNTIYTPNNFNQGHPLAESSMYSDNEQDYVLIAIEGLVDSDANQIPDKDFKLLATSPALSQNISVNAKSAAENNRLNINLNANIANLLKSIDLESVGIQENSGLANQILCDNAKEENVFSNVSTTGVTELVSPQNQIYIDSRLSIAPTIHYKFFTSEQLDMTITNLNGSFFIQRFNLFPEGNFYLDQNLASGLYIVIFTSPRGIRQSLRFVVRN